MRATVDVARGIAGVCVTDSIAGVRVTDRIAGVRVTDSIAGVRGTAGARVVGRSRDGRRGRGPPAAIASAVATAAAIE